MHKKWKEKEIQVLIENYPQIGPVGVQQLLPIYYLMLEFNILKTRRNCGLMRKMDLYQIS